MSQVDLAANVVERAVFGYVAAWNEDDPNRLREILDACWAEDGLIIANHEHIEGRETLWRHIIDWRRKTPGYRGLLISNIEHHHDVFRFTAVILKADGSQHGQALDIGELNPDGRIRRIITFHYPRAKPLAHYPRNLVLHT